MKCSVSTMETLDVFELFECKDKQIRLTNQMFLGKSYPDLHSLSMV